MIVAVAAVLDDVDREALARWFAYCILLCCRVKSCFVLYVRCCDSCDMVHAAKKNGDAKLTFVEEQRRQELPHSNNICFLNFNLLSSYSSSFSLCRVCILPKQFSLQGPHQRPTAYATSQEPTLHSEPWPWIPPK